MNILIFLFNGILVGVVTLIGIFYPSIKNWSYLAICVIGIYLILELILSGSKLPDAAKISSWILVGFANFFTIAALLPFKLGLGDWWAILAVGTTGAVVLSIAVIVLVFRNRKLAE